VPDACGSSSNASQESSADENEQKRRRTGLSAEPIEELSAYGKGEIIPILMSSLLCVLAFLDSIFEKTEKGV